MLHENIAYFIITLFTKMVCGHVPKPEPQAISQRKKFPQAENLREPQILSFNIFCTMP
jgi:hypothetical protein